MDCGGSRGVGDLDGRGLGLMESRVWLGTNGWVSQVVAKE